MNQQNNQPLHVLLIDDNATDRLLVARYLNHTFSNLRITEVSQTTELSQALERDDIDLVITDYQIYWTNGLAVLKASKMRWPDCPVIMFTATGNEEVAVQAMKAGLDDYVLKSPQQLPRLSGAVQSALDKVQHLRVLREAETRYRRLFNGVPVGLYRATAGGRLFEVNLALVRILGYPDQKTLLAMNMADLYAQSEERQRWQALLADRESGHHFEAQFRRFNGEIIWIRKSVRTVWDDEAHEFLYEGVLEDITEYKQVRESLEQLNRELILLNRASQAFISTLDLDEVLTSVLEEVRNSLDVIACSVWLVDVETQELVCRQVTDPQSDIVRGWRLPPGQGLGGWVVQHGQSLIVPDVQKNEQHFKGVDKQTGLPIRSILTIPLRTKKGVIGVLQMVDETVNRFDAADQRLGEALANLAASAIENAQLYEQAQRDAETKAILIDEINHRVKNNLAAIIGLLYAQRRHAGIEDQTAYQKVMKNLINRVQGLATVHSLLSASEWSSLNLSNLATQIIHSALQALLPDKQVLVNVAPSPIRVLPKQAHSLAMVLNELTTNTVKYALQEQDTVNITVKITLDEATDKTARMIIFEFRDDGPGYPEAVLRQERHDVGLYMIQSIIHTDLQGVLTLANDEGAVTNICFKLME